MKTATKISHNRNEVQLRILKWTKTEPVPWLTSGKNFKVTPTKEQSVTKTLFHQINYFFPLSPLSKQRHLLLREKKNPFLDLTGLTGNSLEERIKHLFVSHNMLYFAKKEYY